MVRLLGAIFIAAGIALFFGNFSGVFLTIPGLGILLTIAGGIVFTFGERFDTVPPPGSEE